MKCQNIYHNFANHLSRHLEFMETLFQKIGKISSSSRDACNFDFGHAMHTSARNFTLSIFHFFPLLAGSPFTRIRAGDVRSLHWDTLNYQINPQINQIKGVF